MRVNFRWRQEMRYSDLIGIVRAERALVAAHAFPNHGVEAVVASEVVSVIGPLLHVETLGYLTSTVLAMAYMPFYAGTILDIYAKKRLVPLQTEACTLLLVLCTLAFDAAQR